MKRFAFPQLMIRKPPPPTRARSSAPALDGGSGGRSRLASAFGDLFMLSGLVLLVYFSRWLSGRARGTLPAERTAVRFTQLTMVESPMKRFVPTPTIAQPALTDPLARAPQPSRRAGSGRRARLLWTLGNLFMLIGLVLLFYVGGVYTQAEYDRYAARGDSDLPAPAAVAPPVDDEPAPFIAPVLSAVAPGRSVEGQVVGAIPNVQPEHQSTVSRVVIPSIGVDSKVVEVGWEVKQQDGQDVALWQVAEYAVGQHRGSANPGEGNNVVLAGHVGGYGKVFKDLYYVKPGDQITLYSGGQQYLYTVQQRLLVTEEGVSAEQHAANAQLIAPTDHEVVTMVTCWPPKGPDKFTQRVIVRAVPFGAEVAGQAPQRSNWTIR